MKPRQPVLALLLALALVAGLWPTAVHADSTPGKATKYRVYQNVKALKEFATESQAIAYARQYANSHVELIASRAWVWDNLPKFAVYQGGATKPQWEFRTYEEALRVAEKLTGVHIRNLEKPGFAYSNYPLYQLYQGHYTRDSWGFTTIEAARKEAAKWANAHIIDLGTNGWVWDNYTAAEKAKRRDGQPA